MYVSMSRKHIEGEGKVTFISKLGNCSTTTYLNKHLIENENSNLW